MAKILLPDWFIGPLNQGGSFSDWFLETDVETGTVQALFNVLRTEKWEPRLKINF